MKLSINSHCAVLSVIQFTCLFLCHADSDTTEDIASGSGELPIDIVTNRTASITIEPTSTVPNLLVPFSTDINQPPSSVSIYVIPMQVSSSLSTSLLLPNTVFGPSTTSSASPPSAGISIGAIFQSTTASQTISIFLYQTTSLLPQITAPASPSLSPSPSSLPLVQYIISLTRVVVIDQQRLGAVRSHIRESLAGLLNIQTTDIININILTQQERTKRQSSSEITFSAVEFYIREIYTPLVEQLQRKLRNGEVASIQLSPSETVQLKDIVTSLEEVSTREPEVGGGGGSAALSSGVVAGIALGALAAVILLLLATLIIGFLVFKARRSKESQEIVDLRNTYGYQYTSHAMSNWPPHSPLL